MSFLNPSVTRRLAREVAQLRSNPPEGVRVALEDDSIANLVGIIAGPENTPYEGGYFRVKFQFGDDFPAAPPKCWFVTKLFHPNVSRAGEICVNTLKKDWQSSYGISHILVTIKCLLIAPNPESALDEEAGRLLLEDYDQYCARARLITSVHATPRTRPAEFDEPAREESPAATTSADPASSTTSATTATPAEPAPSPISTDLVQESEAPTTVLLPTVLAAIPQTTAPTPLQPAKSNEMPAEPSAKPPSRKRPAPTTMERRKKALKRL